MHQAVKIVEGCVTELHGFGLREKKEYILEKIRSCIKIKHDSGYLSFKWKLGVAPSPVLDDVCRKCFMNTYMISHGYLDSIVATLKGNVICSQCVVNLKIILIKLIYNLQFISWSPNI